LEAKAVSTVKYHTVSGTRNIFPYA